MELQRWNPFSSVYPNGPSWYQKFTWVAIDGHLWGNGFSWSLLAWPTLVGQPSRSCQYSKIPALSPLGSSHLVFAYRRSVILGFYCATAPGTDVGSQREYSAGPVSACSLYWKCHQMVTVLQWVAALLESSVNFMLVLVGGCSSTHGPLLTLPILYLTLSFLF